MLLTIPRTGAPFQLSVSHSETEIGVSPTAFAPSRIRAMCCRIRSVLVFRAVWLWQYGSFMPSTAAARGTRFLSSWAQLASLPSHHQFEKDPPQYAITCRPKVLKSLAVAATWSGGSPSL